MESTMTTFTYDCKKTGQSVDVHIEALPAPSVAYVLRRGLREYFDNYHALETLKKHNGDSAAMANAVRPLVIEAEERLMIGDVPGERVPTDPKTIAARKMAAELQAAGATADDLVAFMAARKKKQAA
jgi:hypothetical protein